METSMTVTDLVRDTCKAATKLAQRGDRITVTSGTKPLFRIVPVENAETKMTLRQYNAFLKDLDALAKIPSENNGVLKMRARRLRK